MLMRLLRLPSCPLLASESIARESGLFTGLVHVPVGQCTCGRLFSCAFPYGAGSGTTAGKSVC